MESEIIKFISDFTGVKSEKISPDTLVNFDLGVDGDDGAELLEEYSRRFSVDLSPISEKYFGPEGFPALFIVLWPYYLFRRIKGHDPKSLSPLPVRQLVRSVESGKWVSM